MDFDTKKYIGKGGLASTLGDIAQLFNPVGSPGALAGALGRKMGQNQMQDAYERELQEREKQRMIDLITGNLNAPGKSLATIGADGSIILKNESPQEDLAAQAEVLKQNTNPNQLLNKEGSQIPTLADRVRPATPNWLLNKESFQPQSQSQIQAEAGGVSQEAVPFLHNPWKLY